MSAFLAFAVARSGWSWLLIGVFMSAASSLALKWSQGFTQPAMSVAGAGFGLLSMISWGMALRSLPLGIGYVVWEGLGALLSLMIGIALFQERLTLPMVGYALLVLFGCAGLCVSVKQI